MKLNKLLLSLALFGLIPFADAMQDPLEDCFQKCKQELERCKNDTYNPADNHNKDPMQVMQMKIRRCHEIEISCNQNCLKTHN